MRKIIGLLALVLIYFVVNHTSLLSPEPASITAPAESTIELTPLETVEPPPDVAPMPQPTPKLVDADADSATDADHAKPSSQDEAQAQAQAQGSKTLADTKAQTKPLSVAVDTDAPKQAASSGLVSADDEINKTLALIKQGGPFPHKQDATIFQNRERILPKQPRGYYHEYTVRTPGTKTRGARRIVTGGNPPSEYYYTPDHYRTFHKLEANHDLP